MGIEIERKFLVKNDDWRVGTPVLFVQGYLSRDAQSTVRIRIAGPEAMLTVKSKTTGISRAEFEYTIPVADAKEMLKLCEGLLIEKNRWCCRVGDVTWEIDEFLGQNAGLILAEIELDREDQTFDLPDWIGKEVTRDTRYYNSNLSKVPFSTWGGNGTVKP